MSQVELISYKNQKEGSLKTSSMVEPSRSSQNQQDPSGTSQKLSESFNTGAMMEGIGVGLVAKDEVTSGAGPAEGEGYSEELSSPDVKIS